MNNINLLYVLGIVQLKLKSPEVIRYLFRAILKFLLKSVLKLKGGFGKISYSPWCSMDLKGIYLVRDFIEYGD